MSSEDPSQGRIAAILRSGLESAAGDGSPKVHVRHLTSEELDELAAGTLAYLRTRSGKPSHIGGWQKLSSHAARVVPWWAEGAGLSDRKRRRLGSLRDEVYDVLVERDLIARDTANGLSIHVSPAGAADRVTPPVAEAEPDGQAEHETLGTADAEPEQEQFGVDMVGAWVLKGAPHIYDLNLVFTSPARLVRRWAVEIADRAAAMRAGQPVYFWVGDGDPYRVPGIWGAGRVTGPCTTGVAGDGWLDAEAARRATRFAAVEIVVWDVPVSRTAFLKEPRLAAAEVIREPWSDNPSYLTSDEAAALAGYLGNAAAGGPVAPAR